LRPDSGFEQFYQREAQAVFATVFLFCRNQAVAEDATQEAFARALERWHRLRSCLSWSAYVCPRCGAACASRTPSSALEWMASLR
jgi:DNA-directed RNA polymerase specialized sigma24 family protein